MSLLFFLFIIVLVLLIVVFYSYQPVQIAYITDLFSAQDFKQIQSFSTQLYPSIALDTTYKDLSPLRQTTRIDELHPLYSKLHSLFYSESVLTKLQSYFKHPVKPFVDNIQSAIEYRVYKKGASMSWHKDVVLTEISNPQLEMVFTVDNTSDSETQYIDSDTLRSISTQPNSALVIRADGVLHQVTPVTTGERIIFKVIYERGYASTL